MFDDLFSTLKHWFDSTDQSLASDNADNDGILPVDYPAADPVGADDISPTPFDKPVEPPPSTLEPHTSWSDSPVPDAPPVATDEAHPDTASSLLDDSGSLPGEEWLGEIVQHHTTWDATSFDGVGDPFAYQDCWQLQTENSCAVMAQAGIYESITGVRLTEQDICRFAAEHGIYDSSIGTRTEDVGKVLELLNIPTQQQYDASLVDLADALERGERVIVGLDANEIWEPYRDTVTGSPVELSDAGHAVWVTGIDQEPDGSIKIILNDTGSPEGRMSAIDAADFMNAWDDFGNFMVVATPPAQGGTV